MKKIFLLSTLIISYTKSGVYEHEVDYNYQDTINSREIGLLLVLRKNEENKIDAISNFSNKNVVSRHVQAYLSGVLPRQKKLDLTVLEKEIYKSYHPYRYLNYLGFTSLGASLGLLGGYYLGSRK